MIEKLTLLFFAIILQIPMSAQDLTVKSFVQTDDVIARSRNVKGTDGDVCAAVVVRIPSDKATFNGGFIIGKPTYKDGEYIIDMQQNAAQMRISVPGYNTIDVKFRDYIGSTLKSKTTYLLTVNAPQATQQTKKQTLNIRVTPSEAIVLIDGVEVEEPVLSLSIGTHRYNVAAKGYHSQEGTIEIKENSPAKLLVELDQKDTQTVSPKSTTSLTTSSSIPQTVSSVPQTASQTNEPAQSVANGVREEHECVDLGLSVKWATCNVGAEKPEDNGDYYAWGETKTSKSYFWDEYFDAENGSDVNFRKYAKDKLQTLQPEDDVAHVQWGGTWRMPTKKEQEELCKKCTWEWATVNGRAGYKVTSKKNGKSIFLPASGRRFGFLYNGIDFLNNIGCYWSSSLYTSSSSNACYMAFNSYNSEKPHCSGLFRIYGMSIRPVCP